MDVSIIIVNYNTKQLTSDCINSIFEKTIDLSYEVIVVDNASNDGSIDYFSKEPRIVFIESGENLGFGRANNLGLQHSSGDFVFFLNSDTVLRNNAVKFFFDWFKTQEKELAIGAAGCLLVDRNGRRTHSYATFPNAWRYIREIIMDHLVKRFGKKSVMRLDDGATETGDYFSVDYVTGADIFVQRTVIDKYGAFDPDFFMYFEETEMQFRWKKNGLRAYIINGPEIVHLEGASQEKTLSFAKTQRIMRSRILYFKKTLSCIPYFFFRFCLVLVHIHLLVVCGLSKSEKKQFFSLLITGK